MNQNIYNFSKIYKIEPITEHEEHEIYIGSTTKKYLSQRMTQHKSSYKKYLTDSKKKYSIYDLFNKYGVENFNIYLLENYICNDINELRTKEGEYIRNLKCINKKLECITNDELKKYKKEYSKNNKEKIKEYQKKYQNSEKYKEYDKEKSKIKKFVLVV